MDKQQSHVIEVTTLGDLLIRASNHWPEHDALVFPDHRLSFSALRARAYLRARSLLAMGIAPGEAVGILAPNCPEYIEYLFGIALIGAIAVPVNSRYRSAELAYVVDNADLVALITTDAIDEFVDYGARLQEAFPDLAEQADSLNLRLGGAPALRFITLLESGSDSASTKEEGNLPSATKRGLLPDSYLQDQAKSIADAQVDAQRVRVRIRDVGLMMYTSGTTANPKGCPLTHEAMLRNGINMNRERYFLSCEDRFWAPLPMFHMSSILPMVCCFDAGAAWLTMMRVDPGPALRMMEQERATIIFPAFPAITQSLIEHPDFPRTDLSRVRRMNNVASEEMLRRFQAALPHAVQTGAYGMTEVGGVACFNHPDEDFETRLHTCGKPFPGIDVRIVDPETGAELPAGQRGEIQLRGYAMFEGYYKDPEKNAEAFVDGWFRSGDLCSLTEDGAVCFHGRLKDMLKVGGENVAALEIESVLAAHPAVRMAQVIAVPDERLQEVPVAYIECNDADETSEPVSEAELISFCAGQMASFKVPVAVRFISEWPMSSTKVQKFVLQEMYASEENQHS